MNDLISRHAAIDAINKAFERVFAWDGTSPLGDKVLENVPSALPEPYREEKDRRMSDTISRQAAIDTIMGQPPEPHYPSWYAAQIEKLPPAQPEPCEDVVSRKAVYDAMVEKGQRSRRYKLGEIWELNGTEIKEALDTVPSAQP